MARELYQPHDNLFRKVFSDEPEAAGLLRPNLPEWLSTRLDWSTLTLQDRSYVDEELEASQSDLLFEVQWQAGDGQAGAGQAGAGAAGSEPQRLLLYVLFEHQSTPNRWMRFRLLEYCCRIWGDALLADNSDGSCRRSCRWCSIRVGGAGGMRGEALGRVAQLALMAAARRRVSQGRAALLMAAQYMGELARSGRIELFGAIVRYVITTQDKQTVGEFGEALRRHVPGPGGDMKTYAEELLQEGLQKGRQEGRHEGRHEGRQEGRQEGLQKGRQEGQLGTIENFLRAGIEWSVIKEATGIDQEAFQALRRRLEESDRTTE